MACRAAADRRRHDFAGVDVDDADRDFGFRVGRRPAEAADGANERQAADGAPALGDGVVRQRALDDVIDVRGERARPHFVPAGRCRPRDRQPVRVHHAEGAALDDGAAEQFGQRFGRARSRRAAGALGVEGQDQDDGHAARVRRLRPQCGGRKDEEQEQECDGPANRGDHHSDATIAAGLRSSRERTLKKG